MIFYKLVKRKRWNSIQQTCPSVDDSSLWGQALWAGGQDAFCTLCIWNPVIVWNNHRGFPRAGPLALSVGTEINLSTWGPKMALGHSHKSESHIVLRDRKGRFELQEPGSWKHGGTVIGKPWENPVRAIHLFLVRFCGYPQITPISRTRAWNLGVSNPFSIRINFSGTCIDHKWGCWLRIWV